ncbi:glycosyltransferase [Zhihengliuella flava]|uniref:glycosyltransferase n=1 Tax=Zhihengliuella flava TaxID=1285193 RepID=UPI0038B4D79F
MYGQVAVTAVVATRDGAEFLPQTLGALTQQTRRVDRIIGVDASSRDDSAPLLRGYLPDDALVTQTSAHGFGHSVAAGLAEAPALEVAGNEWIWLIHDDSAPAPDALEQLLRAVEASPSVAIAGCKQLDADRPRHLLDVGLSMSRAGERLTMIEADELDQGQHDRRSDSFAVNSAGLLIRRDVFEALGGFDEALPGVGDDLDLCWRARLAGHRVVIVPAARMYHAPDAVKHFSGPMAARRSQVYLRLKHAPLLAVPFITLFAVLGGLGRFIAGLISKDPGHGAGQLIASLAAVLRPVSLIKSRRQAASTRKQRRGAVRALMTNPREVREHRRHLTARVEDEPVGVGSHSLAQTEASNPSGDDRDDFAELATTNRLSSAVGAIVAVLLTAGLSLLGLRHLIGAQALTGGALLPISDRAGTLWANATEWWQATGSGVAGAPDPFDRLLWLLGLTAAGAPNVAVVVLFFAAMPLAAFFAWLTLGAVTGSRGIRLLGAVLYGLAPSLQVALGQGRLSAVVVHLLLPLAALGIIRSIGGAPRRGQATLNHDDAAATARPGVAGTPSWTAAAGAALALAGLVSAAPALLWPAVAVIIIVALAAGRRAKALWWVPLPAIGVVAPLAVTATEDLRVLFADPSVPRAFDAAPLWQQALGFPVTLDTANGLPWLTDVAPGVPWLAIAAVLVALPVLLCAVFGSVAADRAGWTARGALAAAVVLLAASAGAQLVATGVDGAQTVTPFTGTFTSAVVLALLVAAAAGAGNLRFTSGQIESLGSASRARRLGVSAVAVLAGIAVVVAGAGWLVASGPYGAESQVQATIARSLPATAADRGVSPHETRTLVMTRRDGGSVEASLVSGSGSTLDSVSAVAEAGALYGPLFAAERRQDDDATTALRATVASIVSGQALDPRRDLAILGVDFVVLTNTDSSGDYTASLIDVVPSLAEIGRTDAGWLWRVEPAGAEEESGNFTSRVRVVDAQVNQEYLLDSNRARVTEQDVPAGDDGRRLVLAERADAGWQASFNGRPLRATTLEWAQAFELPAEAGTVTVSYHNPWALPIGIVQAVLAVIVILLVLPIRARRRNQLSEPRWRATDHAHSTDGPEPMAPDTTTRHGQEEST